jgi:small redox-active disulfide protein 2
MVVQILGTGCPKCKQLEANARAAIQSLGLEAEVKKVTDLNDIMGMGVMITPLLAIDGTVKSAGKILTAAQIAQMLRGDK